MLSATDSARPRGCFVDGLTIHADKLLGYLSITLNYFLNTAVLIFAILTSSIAYRSFCKSVVSRGVLEKSQETASRERATVWSMTRCFESESDVLEW